MEEIRVSNLEKIKDALSQGQRVFASFREGGRSLNVKNARRNNGRVQVLIVEGWRVPAAVWTDDVEREDSE